ncbi:MAG: GTP-binding protein [Oscillospiraceae bacterium]|nr:GTP-binding protein [Oscillospiraceae bacterium]
MTKIDIYSGFLGAGKTTLIKKMIQEAYKGQKLVLIENEFGEIGIDGGFLQDAGINITEMNSGCICCSLVGDFGKALAQVIEQYHPDRIIIEPSGVGKLSDVIGAVNKVTNEEVTLGYTVAVADAGKVKVYIKNFGEFYNNQIETASTIILSRTDSVPQAKLDTSVALIREHNQVATIVTTPWNDLTGEQLIAAMEGKATLAAELARLEMERLAAEEHHHHHEHDEHCTCGCHDHEEHEHHHHHHDHDEDCCCGHDHEHHHHHHEDCGHHHGDEGCHEHHHGHKDEHECAHHHEHHHHDHDEDCCCGHDHEHHHHHDHDEDCCCGHDHEHHHHHDHDEACCCGHDHEHHHHHHEHDENCTCGCHDHHHHHADEVFTSWGRETHKKFEASAIENALKTLDSGKYGMVLRAKGILPCVDGTWIHFDMVPEEIDIRTGSADIHGKLCVIGSKLDEAGIAALFGV